MQSLQEGILLYPAPQIPPSRSVLSVRLNNIINSKLFNTKFELNIISHCTTRHGIAILMELAQGLFVNTQIMLLVLLRQKEM